VGLSELARGWLLAPVLEQLEAIRVSNEQQEANLQASIAGVLGAVGGVETQVSAVLDELAALRDQLANNTAVDLSQEVAALDDISGRLAAARDALDAAVPDAPPPPPPAP
jgi:ABC-type transporter Mla subunit MlaD